MRHADVECYTNRMLTPGSTAPMWKGNDQAGKERSSVEFSGTWLLLYFYPKDDTPGCTQEACGLRDSYAEVSPRITVVGVSADDEESHRKFAEKYRLPFTLIADTDRSIITAFGADGVTFPKRVTFLIDPENLIRKVYHGFDCAAHAEDVRKDLSEFGA